MREQTMKSKEKIMLNLNRVNHFVVNSDYFVVVVVVDCFVVVLVDQAVGYG